MLMEIFTKEIEKMTWRMAMENTLTKMAKYMKVNGWIICNKVRVLKLFQMELNMRVNLKRV